MMDKRGKDMGSFRDPSGYVYYDDGKVLRHIDHSYFPQYRSLMESGLYDELTNRGYLVKHSEAEIKESFMTICPQKIPYISYPYEWCFQQLKDAAILTMEILSASIKYGMLLKDASAYNVQFLNGKPVFIDTLSFDYYTEGEPWGAYGQFCRHFIAPLLLMAYKDVRLNRILAAFIDGIPLDMAASLLSGKGGLFAKQHIVWHAKSIDRHNQDGKGVAIQKKGRLIPRLSMKQLVALFDSMERGIKALSLKPKKSEWGDYYFRTNYSREAESGKENIVREYMETVGVSMVYDIGANDGKYSRIAASLGADVVSFDIDSVAVERNYEIAKREKLPLLPLVMDINNPSPSIGFANCERNSLSEREYADCVIALAFIHHVVIANNIPLEALAKWLLTLGKHLIIEFVPKKDSNVQLLLKTRRDIFPEYTEKGFEAVFSKFYIIQSKRRIKDSVRTLYLMEGKV